VKKVVKEITRVSAGLVFNACLGLRYMVISSTKPAGKKEKELETIKL
jgi:hypothetical protein